MKFCALLIGFLVAGCYEGKELPPGEYVGEKSCFIEDLGKSDVILVVNGEKFRKSDFEVAVSLADKMRRMCAGDKLTGPNKAAEEYSLWARPKTLSLMLRHALVRQYGHKNGIKPSPRARKSITARSPL